MNTQVENQVQSIINNVGDKLNKLGHENYWNELWSEGIITSQGPYTTKYLIERDYISEFELEFVNKMDLVDTFEDFYLDYILHVAKEINDDPKFDGTYEDALEEAQEDMNYIAWPHLLTRYVRESLIELDIDGPTILRYVLSK